jgi:hypothetical protein
VHEVQAQRGRRPAEQPTQPVPPQAPGDRGVAERDRDDEVGPEQQREPGEEPGDEQQPVRGAVVSRQRAASPGERHREAADAERDRAVPGQRGQPDRSDDDDEGDERAAGREPATPGPGDREHAEDDAHVLREPEEPLGRQRRAERLEQTGEHPEAAGAVEVQEVLVGHVALEDPLREGEHEALLHRRPLVAQQAPQRQRERGQDDPDGHEVPP